MTLSNKILIGFFGFILIYTLMAFTEIRVKGDLRILNDENSTVESIPLENLKYLSVASDFEERITISSSDNPQVKIKSKSGQLIASMKYEMKNDTLFLLKFEEIEERYNISIEVPSDGFSGFSSSKAYIYVSNIHQQTLSIIQTGGRVEIEDKVNLERLNIKSSNKSYTEVSGASIDTLNVHMDHSDFRSYANINRIEGFLNNESDLYSTDIYDVQLKRDRSSRMRMY